MNNLEQQEQALEVRQQNLALQIIRAGSNISTAQQLANFRLATDKDGRFMYPRYKDGTDGERLSWLGDQFYGLAAIAHFSVDKLAIKLDVVNMDREIMESSILRELTLVEMQEAFRKGLMKEYGDYFGLTSVSMIGFLKGFIRSDKKQTASAIIYRIQAKREQEANANFFKELFAAQKRGDIEIPDFSHMRINGPQKKKNYTDEETAAHREKVRQQAAEILRHEKEEHNGE